MNKLVSIRSFSHKYAKRRDVRISYADVIGYPPSPSNFDTINDKTIYNNVVAPIKIQVPNSRRVSWIRFNGNRAAPRSTAGCIGKLTPIIHPILDKKGIAGTEITYA